jgi:ATP-dependent DNA helicase RecG
MGGLEKDILKQIVKNSQVSMSAIAHNLGISHYTVKEYIAKLKKKKVLKRVGSDRGGYWQVIRES